MDIIFIDYVHFNIEKELAMKSEYEQYIAKIKVMGISYKKTIIGGEHNVILIHTIDNFKLFDKNNGRQMLKEVEIVDLLELSGFLFIILDEFPEYSDKVFIPKCIISTGHQINYGVAYATNITFDKIPNIKKRFGKGFEASLITNFKHYKITNTKSELELSTIIKAIPRVSLREFIELFEENYKRC